jgi:hypothetical protein
MSDFFWMYKSQLAEACMSLTIQILHKQKSWFTRNPNPTCSMTGFTHMKKTLRVPDCWQKTKNQWPQDHEKDLTKTSFRIAGLTLQTSYRTSNLSWLQKKLTNSTPHKTMWFWRFNSCSGLLQMCWQIWNPRQLSMTVWGGTERERECSLPA